MAGVDVRLAHWLALGVTALRPLADATGVTTRGALVLAPSIQAALDDAKCVITPMPDITRGTTAALTAHLLRAPPLGESKFACVAARARVGGRAPPSVFSAQARAARVDALCSRVGWLSIVGAGAAMTVARLRAVFVVHHDALHLYHPVWDGARLTVGGIDWAADSRTRTFTIPLSWTESALVGFIRGHWADMLRTALVRVRKTEP